VADGGKCVGLLVGPQFITLTTRPSCGKQATNNLHNVHDTTGFCGQYVTDVCSFVALAMAEIVLQHSIICYYSYVSHTHDPAKTVEG